MQHVFLKAQVGRWRYSCKPLLICTNFANGDESEYFFRKKRNKTLCFKTRNRLLMRILKFDKSNFIAAAGIVLHAAGVALVTGGGYQGKGSHLIHAVMHLQRDSGGNAEVKNRNKESKKPFHEVQR